MTHFFVNGNLWKICDVEPYNENLRRSNGFGYALGVCDNNQKCIFINKFVSSDKYRHILVHEITHSFCFEYGYILDTDTEEMLCNFVADYGKDIIEIADGLLQIISLVA